MLVEMERFLETIAENNGSLFRSMLSQDPGLANATNDQGVSAVLLTVYYRRPDFTRELIEAGAEIGLFEAAALGDTARLEELIGDDREAANRFAPDGFQPLGLAAFFGHLDAALYLLAHGADPNCPSRNAQRVAPLHSAAASNNLRIVAALIESGADVNARQQGGFTALHAAAQNGNEEMVRLLVCARADCAAKNDAGQVAAEMQRKENARVDALLRHCTDSGTP